MDITNKKKIENRLCGVCKKRTGEGYPNYNKNCLSCRIKLEY